MVAPIAKQKVRIAITDEVYANPESSMSEGEMQGGEVAMAG